jgi:hypothetical protein
VPINSFGRLTQMGALRFAHPDYGISLIKMAASFSFFL